MKTIHIPADAALTPAVPGDIAFEPQSGETYTDGEEVTVQLTDASGQPFGEPATRVVIITHDAADSSVTTYRAYVPVVPT